MFNAIHNPKSDLSYEDIEAVQLLNSFLLNVYECMGKKLEDPLEELII